MRIITYILIFFSSVTFAQQDDAYKAFLKCSSVAIHKAQKEMLSHKTDDVGGLLAKSIILQNNALKLYKLNSSRAICTSALARNYAASVIKKMNGKSDAFYLIHDDEKMLLNNCPNDVELYNESKQAANDPSELDKDYINSFNNLKIDFN